MYLILLTHLLFKINVSFGVKAHYKGVITIQWAKKGVQL
jgi:hypothetical protein